jgi:hypothetical protein
MEQWSLFGPIVAAYLVACGGWALAFRLRPGWWPQAEPPRTHRKWLDLALVVVVAAAIMGIGQLWRAAWLLPQPAGWVGDVAWQLNNLLIFAPLFVALGARRQSTETVYLSGRGLPVKLAAGLVLGILAIATFHVLRGEPRAIATTLADAGSWSNLRNFLPVFLEGVAVVFAFVRLRWAIGEWPALLVSAALFAAAHIPRQLSNGLAPELMAAYFAVTAAITVVVLMTLARSRDIVWLGIVHYLMDIAIGAFHDSAS